MASCGSGEQTLWTSSLRKNQGHSNDNLKPKTRAHFSLLAARYNRNVSLKDHDVKCFSWGTDLLISLRCPSSRQKTVSHPTIIVLLQQEFKSIVLGHLWNGFWPHHKLLELPCEGVKVPLTEGTVKFESFVAQNFILSHYEQWKWGIFESWEFKDSIAHLFALLWQLFNDLGNYKEQPLEVFISPIYRMVFVPLQEEDDVSEDRGPVQNLRNLERLDQIHDARDHSQRDCHVGRDAQ